MEALMANLITLTSPRSPVSEAYRTLRTNLLFSGLDSPARALAVTSPSPDEGKSTVVANLAVTMAQGGRSTILVDGDLRHPRQHEIWGVPNEAGLTTLVTGGARTPPLVDVGVEGLQLLPSGPLPPNPADLLGSRRMEEVVAALRKKADVLLFDAPPVIAVTDSALLAANLDGVLLVVRAGHTRREHAERARDLLERLNIRIVGVALTDAEVDTRMDGYYFE
jgi:capsular exopolysaccharide synthesis family protein